jgi:hypothetical protein
MDNRAVELRRLAEEQAALRRVATLVAAGAPDDDLLAAVTSEIKGLFGRHIANTIRWDGDTIRVIGEWNDGRAPTRQSAASSRLAATRSWRASSNRASRHASTPPRIF